MNWYTIPPHTAVEVRLEGLWTWRPHRTRRELQFQGYVRRREGRLHFLQDDWEIAVAEEDVIAGPEPMPEGAAAHLGSI